MAFHETCAWALPASAETFSGTPGATVSGAAAVVIELL